MMIRGACEKQQKEILRNDKKNHKIGLFASYQAPHVHRPLYSFEVTFYVNYLAIKL